MNHRYQNGRIRPILMRGLFHGSVALCAIAASSAAFAQQAPRKSTADTEEVVVTGSRIRGDSVSNTPLTVVPAAKLEASSVVALEQVLKQLPSFGNQGISDTTNAGGDGVSFVELRNLGTSRTLVLVDSQRMVYSGTDTQAAVDINNIPVSLIDRVEILRNGASAIYGSDAIAGVVNVVLKKNFSGLAVNSQVGATDKGDGLKYGVSATFGANFDRGNVTLNAEYNRTDALPQLSRDWAANKILPDGSFSLASSRTYGGRVQNPTAFDKITGLSSIDDQAFGNGVFLRYKNSRDAYLVNQNQYLRGLLERESFNGLAHYDITNTITARADFLFTDHTAQQLLAPDSEGGDITTNAYPNGFVIPKTNPYNPYGVDVTMRTRRQEIGNRFYNENGPTYRIGVGLEGSIFKDYNWEAGYKYGKSNATFSFDNQINQTRLLQVSGYLPCLPSDVARGCSVGNFFGPNSLTPAQAKYIGYTQTNQVGYQQDYGFAKLTGPVIELPAGPLAFAAGFEHRNESGNFQPDNVVVNGDANFDQQPTKGSYSVSEAYLEFKIPLLKDLPFAREVSLDAAGRYSDYNLFGSAGTWNLTLNYAVSDDIRFRGNAGTGFRAPSITDLFAGQFAGPASVTDPCDTKSGARLSSAVAAANCNRVLTAAGINPATFLQQAPQIYSLQGGNPKLGPEESEQWSIGTVVTPRIVPGLAVTVDYYQVRIDNQIVAPDAQTLLDKCYGSDNFSSPQCGLVGSRNQGQLTNVSAVNTNSGYVKTNGIDFGLSYKIGLDKLGFGSNAGTIDLSNENSYLLKYERQLLDGSTQRLEGKISSTPAPYFRLKSNNSITYSQPDWSATWTTRYISGASAYGNSSASKDYGTKVGSVFYNDISASYKYKITTFTVGIDNLLDQNPPFYFDSSSNSLRAGGYDFVGRFIFTRVGVQF